VLKEPGESINQVMHDEPVDVCFGPEAASGKENNCKSSVSCDLPNLGQNVYKKLMNLVLFQYSIAMVTFWHVPGGTVTIAHPIFVL
jgi:hypothetical protein